VDCGSSHVSRTLHVHVEVGLCAYDHSFSGSLRTVQQYFRLYPDVEFSFLMPVVAFVLPLLQQLLEVVTTSEM
jgi:hypothetical protein